VSESRQRLYRTDGIVIRRSDIGEADRILTLYTPARGKLRVVIKGVRRPGSRMAGHVELLNHCSFVLARGRNLDIVTQAQSLATFTTLRQDLERIGWGCYVAELLGQMAPEQADNYPAFQLLLETLERLDQGQNAEMVVRAYELHLLNDMGYRPQLWHCASCNAELEVRPHVFSSTSGGLLCPRCQGGDRYAQLVSLETIKTLRYLQRNGLAEAERLVLPSGCRGEVEQILYQYIRTILERDLNAASFLDTLRGRPTRVANRQS
jgi:DNA repair protein RecO (recombination protein O)